MPSNVSLAFALAQSKFEKAKTPEEKLAALLEMRSQMPSHKGGEKLRSEIVGKIAKLRKEIVKEKVRSKKGSGATMAVRKEGAGQIVLVGLPNSGKSTVLKELTRVQVEIASHAFTTTFPVQGILNVKGARVQLVEAPAIVPGSALGKANGHQVLALVRNADAVVLVLNSENVVEEFLVLEKELKESNIPLDRCLVLLTRSNYALLHELQQHFSGTVYFLGDISSREALCESLFGLLRKIRVYTKRPGKDADYSEPLILHVGSKVGDAARVLHKEFASKIKYARVWGSSRFSGQRVEKEYLLQDGDIVEISA